MKLYYCSSSIESDEKIQFNELELKTDENLTVMWSTFHCYERKCPIELDAEIERSSKNILKML